ncbi:DUF642 domain-containing protein [Pseudomonas sp. Fl5BN2]|uniref:DUF642 domain-containing protein n=1 Tax=unclassified Pseudomonas TaxID=196821 RepID=UPI00137864BF|nr:MULTISPECIES: DUF642 domain-containing protein [unclassified Pseudomonas]NBF06074.1 DUF642 domain-containing protein [Pseudomonas sp. Fl5BN2]NBF11884.1 DUF642 domain-containing protein [Pseudomonas sp. Fl4BN1]
MKVIKKTFSPVALAAVLLVSGNAAFGAEMVVNGSFEAPGCGNNCILNTPAQADFVNGWTTFLSGVEYMNVRASIGSSVAADGVMSVDLANYTYLNGGGIQQNINTVVGARYRLTFSAGNSKYVNRTGNGIINLKVAGQTTSFDTPVATGDATVWETKTYDFTATTPQTTLSFWNDQDPNAHFAFLDKVSVTPL